MIIALATGELLESSGYIGLPAAVTYPVTERDGAIFVELD